MNKTSLAIIGSRTFTDYQLAKTEITKIINDNHLDVSNIVSGGAIGADRIAERYAYEFNIPITVIKPDWSIGKHAGHLRNTDIINKSDFVIAFWDKKSKGTLDSINKSKKQNKPIIIIEI